jgi:hypothetical protein
VRAAIDLDRGRAHPLGGGALGVRLMAWSPLAAMNQLGTYFQPAPRPAARRTRCRRPAAGWPPGRLLRLLAGWRRRRRGTCRAGCRTPCPPGLPAGGVAPGLQRRVEVRGRRAAPQTPLPRRRQGQRLAQAPRCGSWKSSAPAAQSPSPPRRPPDHWRHASRAITADRGNCRHALSRTAHITHRPIPRRHHGPGFAAARLARPSFVSAPRFRAWSAGHIEGT